MRKKSVGRKLHNAKRKLEKSQKSVGEEADKEEEEKAYKRKKVAGKRKIDEDIHSSEEEEPIEDISTRKNTKKYQTLRPRATSVPLFEIMRCLSPER